MPELTELDPELAQAIRLAIRESVADALRGVTTDISALREGFKEVKLLLTGNGDPSKGVVMRLAVIEKQHTDEAKQRDATQKTLRDAAGPLIGQGIIFIGGLTAYTLLGHYFGILH